MELILNTELIEKNFLYSISSNILLLNDFIKQKDFLKMVVDPNLTQLNDYTFIGCLSLSSVSFPNCVTIGGSAFRNCSSLSLVSFPNCSTIGNYAFVYCPSLSSISFPNCTTIGSSAFRSCSNLTSISFPNCTSIGSYAFIDCSNLTSVYLLASSVCTLQGITAFFYTPISYSFYTGSFGSIFVPSSLVSAYKKATNWARYSARITSYRG